MQFFILMIDYGRRGREAVIDPEHTRREIVSQARDLLAQADRSIAFVKFVDGNFIEDVTAEIVAEAGADIEAEPINRLALVFDHGRDLRKHEVRYFIRKKVENPHRLAAQLQFVVATGNPLRTTYLEDPERGSEPFAMLHRGY